MEFWWWTVCSRCRRDFATTAGSAAKRSPRAAGVSPAAPRACSSSGHGVSRSNARGLGKRSGASEDSTSSLVLCDKSGGRSYQRPRPNLRPLHCGHHDGIRGDLPRGRHRPSPGLRQMSTTAGRPGSNAAAGRDPRQPHRPAAGSQGTGWLGEVAAIETTMAAAAQKLEAMRAARNTPIQLGVPSVRAPTARSSPH